MKIAVGADHAGFEYKKRLADFLAQLGYEVTDFGTYSTDSTDYPDFAHPVGSAVESGKADFGVLCCGSGQGVSITANKHQGVRAALVWQKDIAELSRQHNNANVICIPARFIAYELAQSCVETFLTTKFEAGRHALRVAKISC
ncbi:MAG: ribose 5-phosphate isomerase B [Siphonobacter sp.]